MVERGHDRGSCSYTTLFEDRYTIVMYGFVFSMGNLPMPYCLGTSCPMIARHSASNPCKNLFGAVKAFFAVQTQVKVSSLFWIKRCEILACLARCRVIH